MNKTCLSFVLFVAFVVNLSFAAPVLAQRDAMKLNEKLGVAVVKKTDSKEIVPAKAKAPVPVKTGETLEIETRREVNR